VTDRDLAVRDEAEAQQRLTGGLAVRRMQRQAYRRAARYGTADDREAAWTELVIARAHVRAARRDRTAARARMLVTLYGLVARRRMSRRRRERG